MPAKAAKHRQRLTDGSTKMEGHVSGSSICPGTAGGSWPHSAGFFAVLVGPAGGCFLSVNKNVFLYTIKAKQKFRLSGGTRLRMNSMLSTVAYNY